MGYTVYLQSFANGSEAALSETDVVAAFAPFVDTSDPDAWEVRYDEMNTTTLLPSRAETGGIVALTIDRPCGDRRLWSALYDVLAMGHCVVYAQDSERPVAVLAAAAEHMPADMTESFGAPLIASNPDDLLRLLELEE